MVQLAGITLDRSAGSSQRLRQLLQRAIWDSALDQMRLLRRRRRRCRLTGSIGRQLWGRVLAITWKHRGLPCRAHSAGIEDRVNRGLLYDKLLFRNLMVVELSDGLAHIFQAHYWWTAPVLQKSPCCVCFKVSVCGILLLFWHTAITPHN